jgi:ATP-dependent RNA circularization protein (DNA/RNA ligase family)
MEVNVREGNIWFKFDIPEINEGRDLATERKAETLKKWGYPD